MTKQITLLLNTEVTELLQDYLETFTGSRNLAVNILLLKALKEDTETYKEDIKQILIGTKKIYNLLVNTSLLKTLKEDTGTHKEDTETYKEDIKQILIGTKKIYKLLYKE